ncbi:hypothetical protein ACROYT_G035526 [Oculina patagonica]
MVYPVEVLFAPRKSAIVIEVGSSYSIKNSTSLEPQKHVKTLSEEVKIQLEEELGELSGTKLRRDDSQSVKLKCGSTVKWPLKVECGHCHKMIMLRYDTNLQERVTAF